jgi:hypothetical protein
MFNKRIKETSEQNPKLVEGSDYYFENGLMVLTARFLLRRGYCCGNGCRHCPYPGEQENGPLEKEHV